MAVPDFGAGIFFRRVGIISFEVGHFAPSSAANGPRYFNFNATDSTYGLAPKWERSPLGMPKGVKIGANVHSTTN